MVASRIVDQKSGTRAGAVSNVRAASMRIQCIYTTEYLNKTAKPSKGELYPIKLLRLNVRHYSILSEMLTTRT